MAAAQFLADLHLCESVPKLTKTFLDFLENAENTAPLFILGDLFDCWVGDDQLTMPFYKKIADALKNCARPKFLMRGNRDFLLGEKFAEQSGVDFLADPFEIEIANKKLLLSHGDQFCTDDSAYMTFFAQSRNPAWQKAILEKPFNERLALGQMIRQQSESANLDNYKDLPKAEIENLLKNHDCDVFIHGHTHLPAEHLHGKVLRIVLPDWRKSEPPKILELSESGAFSTVNLYGKPLIFKKFSIVLRKLLLSP